MANKRVTDKGRKYLLNAASGSLGASIDVDYHLFKSNITPTDADVDGTYAGAEADFTGYALQHVGPFGAATTNGSYGQAIASPVTYTVGTPVVTTNNIYGYYATPHSGTDVLWAMRFDGAPYAMDATGKSIVINPLLSDKSEFS